MIFLRELTGRHSLQMLPVDIQRNIVELQTRLNVVRLYYGAPMIVTSGYRTFEDQMRINPKSPRSRHLSGKAADIHDPDRILQAWILKNPYILERARLWCEDFSDTPTWVHFQSEPPRSGNRFFKA